MLHFAINFIILSCNITTLHIQFFLSKKFIVPRQHIPRTIHHSLSALVIVIVLYFVDNRPVSSGSDDNSGRFVRKTFWNGLVIRTVPPASQTMRMMAKKANGLLKDYRLGMWVAWALNCCLKWGLIVFYFHFWSY